MADISFSISRRRRVVDVALASVCGEGGACLDPELGPGRGGPCGPACLLAPGCGLGGVGLISCRLGLGGFGGVTCLTGRRAETEMLFNMLA